VVLIASEGLTEGQYDKLLRMTAALRGDPILLDYISQIKQAFTDNRDEDALALWHELDEREKTALWVAPKYGGIFTTDERKRLHG